RISVSTPAPPSRLEICADSLHLHSAYVGHHDRTRGVGSSCAANAGGALEVVRLVATSWRRRRSRRRGQTARITERIDAIERRRHLASRVVVWLKIYVLAGEQESALARFRIDNVLLELVVNSDFN